MKLTKNKTLYIITLVCLIASSMFVFLACGNKNSGALSIKSIEIDATISQNYCLQNEKPQLYYIKVYKDNTKSTTTLVPSENLTIDTTSLGIKSAKVNLHNHEIETEIFVYNKIIENNINAENVLTNLDNGDNLAIVKRDITLNKLSTNTPNDNAHYLISKNDVTIYGFASSLRPKSNLVLPNFIEITGSNVNIIGLNLYPHAGHESAVLVNGTAGAKNAKLISLTLSPNIYPYTINFAGTMRFMGNVGNSVVTNCTLNKSRIDVEQASGVFTLNNTTFNFAQVAGIYLTQFPFYKGANYVNVVLSGSGNFLVADTRLKAYDQGGPTESFIINFDPIDWDMGAFVEYIFE